MTERGEKLSYLHLSDKKTIYYELIDGQVNQPYLVFLHEGLGCIPMWKEFPRQLCQTTGCPGLLYDRAGYGRSSPLKSARTIHYLHEYALNELPQVLQRLIPDQPHILFGHSDGGSISLIYGAEKSQLLKGIVTEAAHVLVEPETIEGIQAADSAFELGNFKGLYAYHGDKMPQIFKAWSQTWLSEWFKHWSIEYLLPSVECAVLAIQGTDDLYGSNYQVHSIVANTAGSSEAYLVKNCGHIPHLEQRDQIIEKVADFIRRLCGEPAESV